MPVFWAPEAEEDFLQALAYLHDRDPTAALRLIDRVASTVEKLTAQPIDGPAQRLRSGKTVRSWPIHPFRFYYERSGGDFLVVRLYPQKRRPIVR